MASSGVDHEDCNYSYIKISEEETSSRSQPLVFSIRALIHKLDLKWYIASACFVCANCAAASLVILLVLQVNSTHNNSPLDPFRGDRVVGTCGFSVKEAHEHGCVWDLMNYAYVPPSCYDDEESSRWIQTYGPWNWYRDREGTATVPQENLSFTNVIYADRGWHIAHCLYGIRSTHVAGAKGGFVTTQAIQLNHTDHCIHILMNLASHPSGGITRTKAELQFMSCATLDYISNDLGVEIKN